MTGCLLALRYFSIGRRPLIAAVCILLAFIACVLWWHVNIPTHLLSQFHARWVPVFELAPSVAGAISIAMAAPRLPTTAALAAPIAHRLSTTFAAILAASAAATGPVAYAFLSVIPPRMVPSHEAYLVPGQPLSAVAPAGAMFSLALTTATLMGATLVLVALLGRFLGLGAALLAYLALILVQSTAFGAYLPLSGQMGRPAQLGAGQLLIAVTACIIGTLVWHRTRAASPLTRSRR